VGSGTVLHTFVGDYNQPEELSVFEGDKVRLLGWAGYAADRWLEEQGSKAPDAFATS
jgi:hypothetical protein